MPSSIRTVARLLAALPLVAVAGELHAQQAGPAPARVEESIDSIVKAEILARGIASAQVVITRGDEVLVNRAWGLADVKAKRQADASTTYRLGSMSKQFTAALLLKQVDRGILALTDPIGRHLKGLKPEWNALTIAQLLDHTSGVPREYRDIKRVSEDLPADSLIALAVRVAAPSEPAGTKFIYSNTGYMLLGALIERTYGKSYGAVLRDEIARPLGLTTLAWCGETEAGGGHAKGYMRPAGGPVTEAPYIHPSQLLSGGVCSSAGDIAQWNRALHGGKVLSAASYAAMTTPTGVAATRSVPYAFGLYVRPTTGGSTVIVHDGATPGYRNENVWYPAESLSVTMLMNTITPDLDANSNLTEVMGGIALGRPAGGRVAPGRASSSRATLAATTTRNSESAVSASETPVMLTSSAAPMPGTTSCTCTSGPCGDHARVSTAVRKVPGETSTSTAEVCWLSTATWRCRVTSRKMLSAAETLGDICAT